MGNMKYIVYLDGWGLPTPIVFPDSIQHRQMAVDIMGPVGLQQDSTGASRILGAGFIILTSDGLECFGNSVSLNVKARDEDTVLINKMLKGN